MSQLNDNTRMTKVQPTNDSMIAQLVKAVHSESETVENPFQEFAGELL